MLWRLSNSSLLVLLLVLILSSASLIGSNASSDEALDPNSQPTIVNANDFSKPASSKSLNIKSKTSSAPDRYDFTADVLCGATGPTTIIDDKDDGDNNNNHDDLPGTTLFQSSDKFSDITFVVGSGSGKNDDSVVRKEFKAHKIILQLRAKTLLELVLESADEDSNDNEGDSSRISSSSSSNNSNSLVVNIPDVDENSFGIMLRYVYTKELDLEQDYPKTEDDATILLKVADRFDITDLKIYIESIIVDKFLLTTNAAKMLSFADSYSCTYLKEAAMEKYALDPTTVTQSSSWSTLVSESPKLLLELLQYTNVDRVRQRKSVNNNSSTTKNNDNNSSNNNNNNNNNNDGVNIDHLSISSLRDRLKENKLELNGSRQILVDRLKNHLEIVGVVNSEKNSSDGGDDDEEIGDKNIAVEVKNRTIVSNNEE